MRFFRAVDPGRWHTARRLAALSTDLRPFIDITNRGGTVETALRTAKATTLDLAKQVMVADLRELQAATADMPESTAKARRQQIGTRLRRLKLGTTTTLQTVLAQDGSLATQPAAIMQALQQHWAGVFTGTPMPQEAINSWLRAAYPQGEGLEHFPAVPTDSWHIRRRDVAKAVRCAGRSAPGPDGLPYAAWKATGGYGIDLLWQSARQLGTDDSRNALETAYSDEPACHFNLGLLCCLPKKTTGTTAAGDQYFRPADTRPLAIVDTANRLLANAARLRWETLLLDWIHPDQRGFLPHRSMLANVVDMEEGSVATSLSQDDGAAILFDFSAAFPSISHDFLHAVLAHIGFPPAALALIRALYHQTSAQLQHAGLRGEHFPITTGIRQGCPLSPLLFVVALDGLLRRLPREVPGILTRMYADDTAVVITDLAAHLPRLQLMFQELTAAANLHLNLEKCILMPLSDRPLATLPLALQHLCPQWSNMHCGDHGTYLGFAVGPGKADRSWHGPVRKAWAKMQLWDWSHLGLLYAVTVWNMHILPTMSFVAQLEVPPPEVLRQTEAMLRKVGYGPGNWCQAADLHHLRRGFGFAVECRSLLTTSRAAMLRVHHWEDHHHGGLRTHRRVARTRLLRLRSTHIVRCGRWADWYRQHPLENLDCNREFMAHKHGIHPHDTELLLAKATPRPWPPHIYHRIRGGFQKAVRLQIDSQTSFHAEGRVRTNLGRFGFRDRRQAARCLTRLRTLAPQVQPKVWAACFGAVWNRWATWRRRQRRGHPCLLGCTAGEDSLEHYCECPRVWSFGSSALGVGCRLTSGKEQWFLTAPEHQDAQTDPQWWQKIALLQYAVLRATNGFRAAGTLAPTPEEAHRALQQGLIEAKAPPQQLAQHQ
jgi:hypothetical protein